MINIAILYTGGTFGCIGQPLSPMPATDFIRQLKALYPTDLSCDFFAAPKIKDSTELNAKDWLELAQLIGQLRANYQHFVIIHGTDTLNYAAAFLHHLFADQLHLIITGSQRPLLNPQGDALRIGSDARDNLDFALAQIQQQPKGVYFAFHQQLYSASSGYKYHTQHDQAFLGLDLSEHHRKPAAIFAHPDHVIAQLSATQLDFAENIRIFNYYISPNPSTIVAENLTALLQNPPHVLILQAFGSGNLNYSDTLKTQLQQLLAQGCWVIISSQVLYGALSQQYATGSWLGDLGVVFDPHFSQADLYARVVLLYMQHHADPDWQRHWQH